MTQALIEEVARALADVESVEPHELDVSIEDHVSTDAIRDLVSHDSDSWRLRFETPNHVVEVTGTEQILVDGEQVRSPR
ncbi:HalOD1 output domain-containing protein [Halorubrum ejinorense]|uniref:HalOD1 output domain-containing protein n=1 Tax=Halorubrum ejinorense TaxID=425309 RepID=A0AAV3SPI6_9EURY